MPSLTDIPFPQIGVLRHFFCFLVKVARIIALFGHESQQTL